MEGDFHDKQRWLIALPQAARHKLARYTRRGKGGGGASGSWAITRRIFPLSWAQTTKTLCTLIDGRRQINGSRSLAGARIESPAQRRRSIRI